MNQPQSRGGVNVEQAPAPPGELSFDLCALELESFRSAMPEETAGLSERVVEMAFRSLYEAIERRDPDIDIDGLTDGVVQALREMNVRVIYPFHERLFSFLNAAMRFLAEEYGYRKCEIGDSRADIARIIWPYTARSRGPEAAADALAAAVMDYYQTHCEIGTVEAADFVSGQCPGLLDWDTLHALMNEIFDFLCRSGRLCES